MVGYYKEEKEPASPLPVKTEVRDVICPTCLKPLLAHSIFHDESDKYGRHIRRYMGWCCNCNCGFEVAQFEKEGRWFIHQFRYYAQAVPKGDWQLITPLPEPPVVMTGPGEGYFRQ